MALALGSPSAAAAAAAAASPASDVPGSAIRYPEIGSSTSAMDDVDFIDDLKRGMSVLLHVKVGKLEPASLRLDEGTGKLAIKTNREGWRAFCHCFSRHYELGKDELEPVPLRVHTRQLNRSVSVVNGGDPHLVKRMLERSLSLLRRFPRSESIDLTFATAETEERFRLWAQRMLSVKTEVTPRPSSRHIRGGSSSGASDNETAISDETPRPQPHQPPSQLSRESSRERPPAPSRSASVHPVQQTRLERRHSLNPFKGHSQRMAHSRESTGSDRGVAETSGGRSGAVAANARGRAGATERSFEDDGSTEGNSWAWKEPPVLRGMQTSRTAGRSRSRSRETSIAVSLGETGYPTEDTPKFGRAASLSRGMDRRKDQQEPDAVDFWDPLGLMSNATPDTPLLSRPASVERDRSGNWGDSSQESSRGRRKKPKDQNTE